MNFNSFKDAALFEHRFWLQILGDHSRFILNALSPKETSHIQQAAHFISLFDNLLAKSRSQLSDEELASFNQQTYVAAMKIRKFKLSMISEQIAGNISVNLPPTFINHMVNELDEYVLVLNHMLKGINQPVGSIHLHLLWLPDGSGHTSAIAGNLDMIQKEMIEKNRRYEKKFNELYLNAIEFSGYMRTGICSFPALNKLDEDANATMNCFKSFLEEVKEGILKKEVLGTLSPLSADHMFREECYYLSKLSMVSKVKAPDCDPTKPRIMTCNPVQPF